MVAIGCGEVGLSVQLQCDGLENVYIVDRSCLEGVKESRLCCRKCESSAQKGGWRGWPESLESCCAIGWTALESCLLIILTSKKV